MKNSLMGIKGNYKYNYHGLMLPLEPGSDGDPTIAVRIIPELNQAFNTRERAPFKIIMETIKYKEIKEKSERTEQQDTIFNKSPKNLEEDTQ